MPSVEIVLCWAKQCSYRHYYALYTTQCCSDSVSEINTVCRWSNGALVERWGGGQVYEVQCWVYLHRTQTPLPKLWENLLSQVCVCVCSLYTYLCVWCWRNDLTLWPSLWCVCCVFVLSSRTSVSLLVLYFHSCTVFLCTCVLVCSFALFSAGVVHLRVRSRDWGSSRKFVCAKSATRTWNKEHSTNHYFACIIFRMIKFFKLLYNSWHWARAQGVPEDGSLRAEFCKNSVVLRELLRSCEGLPEVCAQNFAMSAKIAWVLRELLCRLQVKR